MKSLVEFRVLDKDTGDKYWDIYYIDEGQEFHKRLYSKELKGIANTFEAGDKIQFDLDENYYIKDMSLVAPEEAEQVEAAVKINNSKVDEVKEQQSAIKNIFFAWGCGKLPDDSDLVGAALNWCREKMQPWIGLAGAAKAMGAIALSLTEQFKEACADAALDPDTKAGAAAIKKWLTKMFPAYESWDKLTNDAQKEAIAAMKKAKVE